MTPAVQLLEGQGLPYQVHAYPHNPGADSYGDEAVAALGLSAHQVFKTLVAELDGAELVVAVVPVSAMLNTKALAKTLSAKKAVLADKQKVSRVTGYVLGGVSPLGQKKRLRTVIDQSARNLSTIHVSAGRRGLEIELAPDILAKLCQASFADIAVDNT